MDRTQRERQVILEMIDFFKTTIYDPNDKYMQIKLRKWISEIITIEAMNLGYETEIRFGFTESKKNNNKRKLIINFDSVKNEPDSAPAFFSSSISDTMTPSISIIEEKFYRNIDCEDYFKRVKEIISITQALFHELNHWKLDTIARTEVSSYKAFRYVESLMLLVSSTRFYKSNHNTFFMEEEADLDGIKKLSDLTSESWFEKSRNLSHYKNTNEVITERLSGLSKFSNRETFDYFFVANKLKKNTQFIEGYPILKKYYNNDGTEKNITELVTNMKNEISEIESEVRLTSSEKEELLKDCTEMYYEFIYRAIVFQNLDFIDIDKAVTEYNSQNKRALFSDIKNYFKQKILEESEKVEKYFDRSIKGKELKSRQRFYKARLFLLAVNENKYMINKKKEHRKDDELTLE